MPMVFPEELIFGIPEIDEQHRNLFDMYNSFSEDIEEGHGMEGLMHLFERLEDFTAYHFRFEERLIEKSNYPNAEVHLQEHIQTIDDLKQFKAMMNSGVISKETLLSIKRYLIRFLIHHTKTVMFVSANICKV